MHLQNNVEMLNLQFVKNVFKYKRPLKFTFLEDREMEDLLWSNSHLCDHVIGSAFDAEENTLVFCRGDGTLILLNIELIELPVSAWVGVPVDSSPNYQEAVPIDYGLAVQFGNFKVAADFILKHSKSEIIG